MSAAACTINKIIICVKNSVELNQCEIRLSGESHSKRGKYSQLQMLCYGIFLNETIIHSFWITELRQDVLIGMNSSK